MVLLCPLLSFPKVKSHRWVLICLFYCVSGFSIIGILHKIVPSFLLLSTTEKECLAVIYWIKHFRPYLWGKEFMVETDHNALKWLNNVKDDYSRLTRWSIWLTQYKYTIQHCPGKLHINLCHIKKVC